MRAIIIGISLGINTACTLQRIWYFPRLDRSDFSGVSNELTSLRDYLSFGISIFSFPSIAQRYQDVEAEAAPGVELRTFWRKTVFRD